MKHLNTSELDTKHVEETVGYSFTVTGEESTIKQLAHEVASLPSETGSISIQVLDISKTDNAMLLVTGYKAYPTTAHELIKHRILEENYNAKFTDGWLSVWTYTYKHDYTPAPLDVDGHPF